MAYDWEHLVSLFSAKFFFVEAKFFLAELGRVRLRLREDVDTCVKRFHDKALGCCAPVEEEVFINVCLHVMLEEHQIFLKNLSFPTFSKLMEAAHRTVGP